MHSPLAPALTLCVCRPGPARYIPICLPAFTPANCGREDEAGNHMAKSSAAMDKLRALHANNKTGGVEGGFRLCFKSLILGVGLGGLVATHILRSGLLK